MCSHCSKTPDDPEMRQVLAHLNRKYTELADMLGRTLEITAEDDAPRRAGEARAMAELLTRIVGGKPTAPGEFPECCLIGRESTIGTVSWFCTGVLVHPRVVLSAAHCVKSPVIPNVVALNAINFDRLDDAETVPVRRAVVHPSYVQTDPLNDIAVLVLRRGADTPPVPMATTEELRDARRTTLVGFGNDNVFSTRGFGIQRRVTVDIARHTGAALEKAEQQFEFESDLEFLAGGAGFDSCNGDSGGPAYIDVDDGRRVAGLTSRGIPDTVNPCGEGGLYTRVDVHRDFIGDVMRATGVRGDL